MLENGDENCLLFRDSNGLLTPPFGAIKVNEGPKGAASRILYQMTGIQVPLSILHSFGPFMYTVSYSMGIEPDTLDGNEIWLSQKDLEELCQNSPERLSLVAQELCEKGLHFKFGTAGKKP